MSVHALKAPAVAEQPTPAVVPASHSIRIRGVDRDALFVTDIALRMTGKDDEREQAKVRKLIKSGALFALTTGRSYLIPVDAYLAFLRGEQYPPETGVRA